MNVVNEGVLNADYRDMVECLLREGVDFMLVGGYALALHGWPRTTFDIDFWIMANPENAKAVMRAIQAFGAPLMGVTESDFSRPGIVFQIGTEPQRIDILSAVDGLDYADVSSRAVKMTVDGLEVKVIPIDDLIVNKRASGRPKDIADALALEKLKEKANG
ncbi:MAG: nucleotidyltransferase [Kiritimatiellae bacterium]|nr:nucleotidyltransferase [Kiritimatiellia bacterium]